MRYERIVPAGHMECSSAPGGLEVQVCSLIQQDLHYGKVPDSVRRRTDNIGCQLAVKRFPIQLHKNVLHSVFSRQDLRYEEMPDSVRQERTPYEVNMQ